MKLLTLNFLTCARKACKQEAAAFPLHPQEAELEQVELDMNPLFIKNILLRVDWEAMKIMSQELGLPALPAEAPEPDSLETSEGEPTRVLKDLHTLLMETTIANGKLKDAAFPSQRKGDGTSNAQGVHGKGTPACLTQSRQGNAVAWACIDFAPPMDHDLRSKDAGNTPINSILGWLGRTRDTVYCKDAHASSSDTKKLQRCGSPAWSSVTISLQGIVDDAAG
ncbi:hypothetical protein M8818_001749 [Zalaria obscura]|uniref:Uncharacterized protein n=1 Tax=Zalaria obscura TaxID=2024903 RepID=A0ACC3SJN6_9PEZI